jgi:SPP1 family predicted phage head-tail adaptor
MNPGELRHRIDIWGNVSTTNELGETEYSPSKIKTLWAAIMPQTGKLQVQQANTILSNVTHKIIVRYGAGNDITQDMYIIFRGKRFNIDYILNPYFKNETLELFCEEVIE